MMAERETETDAREEAWVIATNPDFPIRARNVNWFLERGGSIKEVRLTESETGEWSVWLRLAGRSGEHRLAMFKSDEPRVYRDVARAIAMCRDDFGYFGPITLVWFLTLGGLLFAGDGVFGRGNSLATSLGGLVAGGAIALMGVSLLAWGNAARTGAEMGPSPATTPGDGPGSGY